MTNFKGTKGKWDFNPIAKKGMYAGFELDFDFGLETASALTLWCNDENPNEEELANAILISKAPKMLEMLEMLVDNFDLHGNSDEDQDLILKAKQLIKEATEL